MNTTTATPATIGSYTLDGLVEIADSPKETAALHRTMLRQRTGLRFSVTTGRGTAANHLYISAGNVDDISEHRDAYRAVTGRAIGHPLDILLDRSDRVRTLCLVAGADPAAAWLDEVAPRRDYGY
jgi:hypothetical protein